MFNGFAREIRLQKGAVHCDGGGLFVGLTPLLKHETGAFGFSKWAPRPLHELEADLSACYGLPVDMSRKLEGLGAVARALNQGDVPVAIFAALHLELPFPPPLGKGEASARQMFDLAKELLRSGMLKEWNSDEHPRLGGPPNAGRFADKPKTDLLETQGWTGKWQSKGANRAVRDWAKGKLDRLKGWGQSQSKLLAHQMEEESAGPEASSGSSFWDTAEAAARAGGAGLEAASPEITEASAADPELLVATAPIVAEQLAADAPPLISDKEVAEIYQELDKLNLNPAVRSRYEAQVQALRRLPARLDELQSELYADDPGFDAHHIVEQNPANLAKRKIIKFGSQAVQDESNIVNVPTLAHERITAQFNSTDKTKALRQLYRQVINEKDFPEQRENNIKIMKELGILK